MALSTVQTRILNAVSKGFNTRKAIADETGMKKGFAAVMGAVSKGKCGKGTLVGDGLLKADKGEGGEWVYTITASGKKALAQVGKPEIAASMEVRCVVRKPAKKAAKKGKKAAKKAAKKKADAKAAK